MNNKNVFINCPFDGNFLPLLKPLLFTIVNLGYTPRLALESSDSSELRLQKIFTLIRECPYSIHDLSRVKSSKAGEYFRLNMPFELGVDFGLKHLDQKFEKKKFLILEAHRYDYMKALSDLNGVDIKPHNNNPEEIIECVVSWFTETIGLRKLGSPLKVWYDYADFNASLFAERFEKYSGSGEKLAEKFAINEIEKMPIPEFIDELRERFS